MKMVFESCIEKPLVRQWTEKWLPVMHCEARKAGKDTKDYLSHPLHPVSIQRSWSNLATESNGIMAWLRCMTLVQLSYLNNWNISCDRHASQASTTQIWTLDSPFLHGLWLLHCTNQELDHSIGLWEFLTLSLQHWDDLSLT